MIYFKLEKSLTAVFFLLKLDTGLNKIPTTLLHDCGKLENYVKRVDQMRPSCVSD